VIELSLTPSTNELRLGEKRRLAVEISSEAPVGMAVLTLRFDPKVIKINFGFGGQSVCKRQDCAEYHPIN